MYYDIYRYPTVSIKIIDSATYIQLLKKMNQMIVQFIESRE